ncbi:MAG: GTP cyclohydrolase I FolE2 [Clostridiales bacterium]|nr:MAG: GTP cyclohydrolase I FolE2 [Clostridiales bacterium]
MRDIQSEKDTRGVYLSEVGINRLKIPVEIVCDVVKTNTVAEFSLAVGLDETCKGTHMSRFIEIIKEYKTIDINNLEPLLKEIIEKENAKSSFVEFKFPYFIEKAAPVSGVKSLVEIEVELKASIKDDKFSRDITLFVPITTLCPCSKAISKYGAHNQRTIAKVKLVSSSDICIEKMVSLIEKNASCEVYTILKRPDEKYVTEKAYENAKFVEDVARDIYLTFDKMDEISEFEISVESQESIHNHNAYAKAVKRGN